MLGGRVPVPHPLQEVLYDPESPVLPKPGEPFEQLLLRTGAEELHGGLIRRHLPDGSGDLAQFILVVVEVADDVGHTLSSKAFQPTSDSRVLGFPQRDRGFIEEQPVALLARPERPLGNLPLCDVQRNSECPRRRSIAVSLEARSDLDVADRAVPPNNAVLGLTTSGFEGLPEGAIADLVVVGVDGLPGRVPVEPALTGFQTVHPEKLSGTPNLFSGEVELPDSEPGHALAFFEERIRLRQRLLSPLDVGDVDDCQNGAREISGRNPDAEHDIDRAPTERHGPGLCPKLISSLPQRQKELLANAGQVGLRQNWNLLEELFLALCFEELQSRLVDSPRGPGLLERAKFFGITFDMGK